MILVPGTVFSNPHRWFFFWPQIVFSHTHASQYSPGCSRGTLTDQSFALCVPLSPLLVLPRLSALSPQLRDSAGLCLCLPSLSCGLHPSLKALVEGIPGSHLIYFLPLRDHSSFLPDVQCAINQCLIYFCLLFIVGMVLEG